MSVETITLTLPRQIGSVLESMVGETPAQKIAHLLSGEIGRHLAECEQELLKLEIKYGLERQEFQQKLQTGELGDEFGYNLEMDALRWEDLLVEKKHWLHMLKGVAL